jgi:hypothetical protein
LLEFWHATRTEQANTRKVCGRILRRVAAGFGEDIAPDAASAWG